MNKIKVLHILSNINFGGGVATSVTGICIGLKKNNIDVHIAYSTKTKRSGPKNTSFIELLEKNRIPTYNIPYMIRNINIYKDYISLIKLRNLINQVKPDIVHTHMSKAGILGRYAAFLEGVPHIIHSVRGWSFYSPKSQLLKKIYIIIERFISKKTSKFCAVSSQQVVDGIEAGIGSSKKYMVIRTGISIKKFEINKKDISQYKKIGVPENVKIVGSVMGLARQKAPLDFLATCKQIYDAFEDVHFIIIGDGPLKAKMIKRIKEYDLEDRFHLLGHRDDIWQLLSIMDVFLLTSHWEGLPRVFMEAISAGIPIVATNVGGAKELIDHGETGFLASKGDIQTLAGHVVTLLEDPDLAKKFIKNAKKKLSDEFELSTVVNKHIQLYKELLK